MCSCNLFFNVCLKITTTTTTTTIIIIIRKKNESLLVLVTYILGHQNQSGGTVICRLSIWQISLKLNYLFISEEPCKRYITIVKRIANQ